MPKADKRLAPRVTKHTAVGRDADLQVEVVLDAHGTRIDASYTEELVAEARKVRGRPSLDEGRSPQVAFRLPPRLRVRAAEVAAAEGKTISQLAREALEERLDHNAS